MKKTQGIVWIVQPFRSGNPIESPLKSNWSIVEADPTQKASKAVLHFLKWQSSIEK